jgi:hypothetical protein
MRTQRHRIALSADGNPIIVRADPRAPDRKPHRDAVAGTGRSPGDGDQTKGGRRLRPSKGHAADISRSPELAEPLA